MRRASASVDALIDGPPAVVYAVLADYAAHHPRIMPPSLFSSLEVERGGIGAGTVFHITLRVPGRPQRLHMEVAEPEPGRLLTERELETGSVTAFTVLPAGQGTRTLARISTEWETGRGVRGLLSRWCMPVLVRRILAMQLGRLKRYVNSFIELTGKEGNTR